MPTNQIKKFFKNYETKLNNDFGIGTFTPRFMFKDPVPIGYVIVDNLWVEEVFARIISKSYSGDYCVDLYCENLQANGQMNTKRMSYGHFYFKLSHKKTPKCNISIKPFSLESDREVEREIVLNDNYKTILAESLTKYLTDGWLDEFYTIQKQVEYRLRFISYMKYMKSINNTLDGACLDELEKQFRNHEHEEFVKNPSKEISFHKNCAIYNFLRDRNESKYEHDLGRIAERQRIGEEEWTAKIKKKKEWAMALLDQII